jgi:mannose-6-phosphate isomerase
MNLLYPLKFTPIILDKMWGGSKLKNILHKPTQSDKAGESWEISGVDGHISQVSNGFLAGNNLEELLEVYMGDLVGDPIFEKFGIEFPLLIKFIDASDILSIQVHPDDTLAKKRHNSFGKTEMWYILQADQNAELMVGFNRKVDKEIYLKQLNEKKLTSILNSEIAGPGDVFFLPAGRVHAIGAGILLAEIQQTSDITYRIYDFDRRDTNGKLRELHTEQAIDAIDYNHYENYKTAYYSIPDHPAPVIACEFFTTNKLELTKSYVRDVSWLDCFVIYMCLEGICIISTIGNEDVQIQMGETVLLPASMDSFILKPDGKASLLEVYIEALPDLQ